MVHPLPFWAPMSPQKANIWCWKVTDMKSQKRPGRKRKEGRYFSFCISDLTVRAVSLFLPKQHLSQHPSALTFCLNNWWGGGEPSRAGLTSPMDNLRSCPEGKSWRTGICPHVQAGPSLKTERPYTWFWNCEASCRGHQYYFEGTYSAEVVSWSEVRWQCCLGRRI